MAKKTTDARPRYAAPALEKGLDILELLASRDEPMSQSEIARALGRTPAEIFRMLNCLDRRGYLDRSPIDDRYRLSAKLYELAHHHPPTRRLLDVALPEMRALAADVHQSCHLVVRHEDEGLVVAQVDGPDFIGFSVRVGAHASLIDSCSGHVLLAFEDPESGRGLPEMPEGRSRAGLAERLRLVRERGYEEIESKIIRGVTDVGMPVLGPTGHAVASLTIPCLTRIGAPPAHQAVRPRLAEATRRIVDALAGRHQREEEA